MKEGKKKEYFGFADIRTQIYIQKNLKTTQQSIINNYFTGGYFHIFT